jgi:hypothetical protein
VAPRPADDHPSLSLLRYAASLFVTYLAITSAPLASLAGLHVEPHVLGAAPAMSQEALWAPNPGGPFYLAHLGEANRARRA